MAVKFQATVLWILSFVFFITRFPFSSFVYVLILFFIAITVLYITYMKENFIRALFLITYNCYWPD